MKVYDKESWHIDAGEDREYVKERFKAVFDFLYEKDYLSDLGKRIYKEGIDDEASIYDDLLTPQGNEFMMSLESDGKK